MLKSVIRKKCLLGCAVTSMAFAPSLQGQVWPTFSIDMQSRYNGNTPGPNTGVADGMFGIPIDEGSILTPTTIGPLGPNPPRPGPLPPPGLMVGALPGAGGFAPGGLGFNPPIFGLPAMELDALSYGHDYGVQLMFSVDEWAGGDPLAPPLVPNMRSEGPLAGINEAAADVFVYNGVVNRTPPPIPGTGPNNRTFLDGDGLGPSGQPGLGLLEPMVPGCLFGCFGDNLDALDINSTQPDVLGPIFFSLDAGFIDPLDGPPLNGGTAPANGFSGADVLMSRAGGVPTVYIQAPMLGLDLNGFDTDDLDALILQDNGDGIYDPAVDRVLFSVRRGSNVIGKADSMFGVAIEEGDVLSVPIPGGIGTPSLYIAAEALGLATVRSGTVQVSNYGDELDALDLFLRGDLDGDGFVGINDLNIILTNWNQVIPPGNPTADVNADGFVGIADLNIILANWNNGAPLPPGGAAVPEPATGALLTLGVAALIRRRR